MCFLHLCPDIISQALTQEIYFFEISYALSPKLQISLSLPEPICSAP